MVKGVDAKTAGIVVAILAVIIGIIVWMSREREEEELPPPPVFVCSYCGTEFSTEEERNTHIEIAHLSLGYYQLKVKADPVIGGWVVLEPDKGEYAFGEIVRLTAKESPSLGYKFRYWDCDGAWLDTTNPLNFLVAADHTLTAHFKQ